MGAEGSKAEANRPEAWGACTTLLDDAAGLRMLVSCACTAIGEVGEGEEHEIPVEHDQQQQQPGGRMLPDEVVATKEPMTFSEATGTARLDAARRSRAQEVRESEQNFLREFTTMMRTGLTVVMRYEDDELTPVHLMLVPYKQGLSAVEWHYRNKRDAPVTGRVPLDEIQAVTPGPEPGRLGYDLAARSFVVVSSKNDTLLFHADSKDICSLLVDGLQMCLKRRRKRAKLANNNPKKSRSAGPPPPLKDLNL